MSPCVQSSFAVAACLLLVLCTHPSTGAAFLAIADTNPDHPNSCWLKDINKTIPVGGTLISENKCEQYICEAGTQLLLSTHQCGVFAPPPGCVNKRDLTKPYPRCCGGEFVCN